MVCGSCTSVGLTEGFDSPVAALALGIAAITMFDATTARRAAGHQARVLNVMIEELFKEHKLRHTRLKKLLGHTRKEVFAGMLVGIAVALLSCTSGRPRKALLGLTTEARRHRGFLEQLRGR